MTDVNPAALVALTDFEGIGDRRALELYRAFGSVEELRTSPLAAFDEFHYVDAETHEQLQDLGPVIEEYRDRFDRYRADGIEVIGIGDERYPASLRQYPAPLVLYARGNVDRLNDPSVSVSGSRDTNGTGRDWIREVAQGLATEGYTVVSGGAAGADTAAHEGALAATGSTVVVLGTGVDTPYPEENEDLFSDIVDAGGLLLSHRPPDAGPRRHAFLDRNRTISALSPGIIIVATDGSGGTMAQYEVATDQNRLVFVPDTDQKIHPNGGLKELRSEDPTFVVSSATEIAAELGEAQSPSDIDNTNTDASEVSDSQTDLDDWG